MITIDNLLTRCKANCPHAFRNIICFITQVSSMIGIWTFVFGLFLSYAAHTPYIQEMVHTSIFAMANETPFLPFHLYINLTIVVGSIMIVLPRPAWWITFLGTTPTSCFVILFTYYTLAQRIEPAPFYVYIVLIGWMLLQWVLTIYVADGKLR